MGVTATVRSGKKPEKKGPMVSICRGKIRVRRGGERTVAGKFVQISKDEKFSQNTGRRKIRTRKVVLYKKIDEKTEIFFKKGLIL